VGRRSLPQARRPERRARGQAAEAGGGGRARARRSLRTLGGVSDREAPSSGTAYYIYGVVPLEFPAGAFEGEDGVGARRVELVAKAYLDRARFLEAAGAAPAPASPSGREYMLRRQRERTLDEERERFKAECARASHERLAAAALAAQANPPQPPEVSGRTDEMVLNGAYLVEAADGALADAVSELEGAYGPRG